MRPIEWAAVGVIVGALLAQSLSLALRPETDGGSATHASAGGHLGSHEVGSEPLGHIRRTAIFRTFLVRGVEVAIDALFPQRAPHHFAGKAMTRAAWDHSTYYRPGLEFHNWTRSKAAWEARRYDSTLARRFATARHPRAARWGYWLGRLVFFWVALMTTIACGILVVFHHIISRRLPPLR